MGRWRCRWRHGPGWGMLRSMRREDELARQAGSARGDRAAGARASPGRTGATSSSSWSPSCSPRSSAWPPRCWPATSSTRSPRGGPDAGAHGRADRAAHRRRSPSSTRCCRWPSGGTRPASARASSYDLRTQVYDHVQRMPLQFFTRTQTGALVSRLNNDVLGAQQAFTSTLSGVVSNVIQLVLTAGVMFTLSWQVTAAVAGAAAGVHPAGPPGRPAAGRDHPRVVPARRQDERDHDRAVRRGRRAAGQAVRPARGRGRRGSPTGPAGSATSASSRPCTAARSSSAMLLVAVAGAGAHLRARRLARGAAARSAPAPWSRLALLLTRLYGPLTALSNVRVDVMSALVSFERVFEVLDLPPAIAEKPDAGAGAARAPAKVEFRDVRFRYPTAAEVSLASLEDVAALDRTVTEPVLRGRLVHRRAGTDGRAGRPVRRRQVHHRRCWCRGSTTSPTARCWSAASTCATRRWTRCATPSASSPRTRTCSTRRSPRTCATPSPTPPTTSCGRALRRRPDRRPGPDACPTASTPWSASAATGSPAARSSASPSPGCCSRPRRS